MAPKLDYQVFIGIDIAKDSFVVATSNDRKTPEFPNNLKGFKEFHEAYKNILKQAFITLEVTGRYEMAFLKYLVKREYHVHRARPIQVKNFIRSLGQKGKTDAIDALALVTYGQERHQKLPLFESKEDILDKLDALSKRRDNLVAMQVQEKNRLQAPDNHFIKNNIKIMLESIQKSVKDIEKQIDEIYEKNEVLQNKVKIAQEIPGIGKVTAQALISTIPELGMLDRRKVASLIGLAPHPRDSGKKSGYRKTCKGRQMPKKTLFISAMAASRSHSSLGVYYKKKIEEGKKPIVAIVALMRKILVILNARIRALVVVPVVRVGNS